MRARADGLRHGTQLYMVLHCFLFRAFLVFSAGAYWVLELTIHCVEGVWGWHGDSWTLVHFA